MYILNTKHGNNEIDVFIVIYAFQVILLKINWNVSIFYDFRQMAETYWKSMVSLKVRKT